jgi:hypothetical protein
VDRVQEEDRFVVFIRRDPSHSDRPDGAERALVSCASYEEARRIRRECLGSDSECIIRFVGASGGGD